MICLLHQAYVPAGENRDYLVGGVHRLARVVGPSKTTAHPPVVFCFHGGGGQAYYAVDEYAIQKNWPEALVYYAQGRSGWGAADLPFFDAMVHEALAKEKADPGRVYVMGYSTGANFGGDLWRIRAKKIAGFAFVSGGKYEKGWPFKPVFLAYGAQEPSAPRLKALAAKLPKGSRVIVHSGGHTYPQQLDAELAAFLKEH